MKRLWVGLVLVLMSASAGARHHSSGHGLDPDAPTGTVTLQSITATVAFSPHGQGENLIVSAIQEAKTQVLVQAYGFSNKAILAALTAAKARGVDVKVILDKSNDRGKYSGATFVSNAKIPVWIDNTVAIAHNKVIVIDQRDVITGSYNFTEAAQNSNAENVLFLQGVPELAKIYIADWNWRQSKSYSYGAKAH